MKNKFIYTMSCLLFTASATASVVTEYSFHGKETFHGSNRYKFCLVIDKTQRCSSEYDASTPSKLQNFQLRMASLEASLAFSEVWRNKGCDAKKALSPGFNLDEVVSHFENKCGLTENERTLVQNQVHHLARMKATLNELSTCQAKLPKTTESGSSTAR